MKDETPGAIAGETLEQVGDADSAAVQQPARTEVSTGKSAFFVGAGILISRVVGLVRQRIFAHYFGSSAEGDAFSAAFRRTLGAPPSRYLAMQARNAAA